TRLPSTTLFRSGLPRAGELLERAGELLAAEPAHRDLGLDDRRQVAHGLPGGAAVATRRGEPLRQPPPPPVDRLVAPRVRLLPPGDADEGVVGPVRVRRVEGVVGDRGTAAGPRAAVAGRLAPLVVEPRLLGDDHGGGRGAGGA